MTKDEALRMAIEAMESAELVWASAGIVKMHEAIEACKYALAETQKPVAYYKEWEDKSGKHKDIKFEFTEGYTLLCTPPSSRDWVGLSDEDIEQIVGEEINIMYSGDYKTYRAIEAKLREKNNG